MSSKHAKPPTEQRREQADLDPIEVAKQLAFPGDEAFLPSVVNGNMLASYDNLPTSQGKRPVCTWPLDTVEGRAKLHQCTQGGSFVLWDRCENGPHQIEVCHIAASFSEWEKEEGSGELISGPMIYLVGPTAIFHSGSDLVYRSLQELALLEGLPPWEPPVILQAERVPTRNRRTRIALTYIGRGRIKDGGVV